MKRLDDNELERAVGGIIFNASGITGSDPNKPWEVLNNNNGNKIDAFATKEEAERKAREFGSSKLNVMEVDWKQVCFLRDSK